MFDFVIIPIVKAMKLRGITAGLMAIGLAKVPGIHNHFQKDVPIVLKNVKFTAGHLENCPDYMGHQPWDGRKRTYFLALRKSLTQAADDGQRR